MHAWAKVLFLVTAILMPVLAQEGPPVMRRKPAPSEEKAPDPPPAKAEDKKAETKQEAEPAAPSYPTTQRPVSPSTTSKEGAPPVLRRGPPKQKSATGLPEDDTIAPAAQPATTRPGASVPPSAIPERVVVTDSEGRVDSGTERSSLTPAEELLERAREAAYEFTGTLPNFICDEYVSRMTSDTRIPDWKMRDQLQVELLYVDSKEDYRNVRRNGKLLKKGSPEDSGTWSTGEFGSILNDIFHPSTRADFRPRGTESSVAGMMAKVYDFTVQQPNSHWEIRYGRSVRPAYKGSLWVELKTARVLRIEMSSRQLPADYEIDTVETTVEYGWVTISGQKYLLPVKSQNLSCQRGTYNCMMNDTEFRNYRKFAAESQLLQVESDISFPEAEDGKKKPESKVTPPSIDPKDSKPPVSKKKQ